MIVGYHQCRYGLSFFPPSFSLIFIFGWSCAVYRMTMETSAGPMGRVAGSAGGLFFSTNTFTGSFVLFVLKVRVIFQYLLLRIFGAHPTILENQTLQN